LTFVSVEQKLAKSIAGGDMSTINIVPQLRKIRLAKRFTLEQVSNATGIGIPNLSEMERGNYGVSKDAAAKLADFYGRDTITEMELLYPERYAEQQAA
jgi:transcriptional regulator with XRE-family HTH domain